MTQYQPIKLYIDANGMTMLAYRFNITDQFGNLCFSAETINSMYSYKMRLIDSIGNEVLRVEQQKKLSMMAINFNIIANNQFISQILQKIKKGKYSYICPELGLVADGDFLSLNFRVYKNNQEIAVVNKKLMGWGDSYELTVNDQNNVTSVLAIVLATQLVTIYRRRRRR